MRAFAWRKNTGDCVTPASSSPKVGLKDKKSRDSHNGARDGASPNMKLHGVRGTVVDPYWIFIIRLLYAATVDRIAE
jgi:hypothetical protein